MFACSTRHVILHGNVLVGPGIVMVEFLGMQTLYLLVLIRITGIDLAFGVAMHQFMTMPSSRL